MSATSAPLETLTTIEYNFLMEMLIDQQNRMEINSKKEQKKVPDINMNFVGDFDILKNFQDYIAGQKLIKFISLEVENLTVEELFNELRR